MSNRDLKIALFGTEFVSDEMLQNVITYAKFIQLEEKKKKVAQGDVCVEDCISILEGMKERAKQYPVIGALYGDEYVSTLAKVEGAALDKAITALKVFDRTDIRKII